jgi:hypothetical protein
MSKEEQKADADDKPKIPTSIPEIQAALEKINNSGDTITFLAAMLVKTVRDRDDWKKKAEEAERKLHFWCAAAEKEKDRADQAWSALYGLQTEQERKNEGDQTAESVL